MPHLKFAACGILSVEEDLKESMAEYGVMSKSYQSFSVFHTFWGKTSSSFRAFGVQAVHSPCLLHTHASVFCFQNVPN